MPVGCRCRQLIVLFYICFHLFLLDSKGEKMKICFPTENLKGLDSIVYGHFGSAPGFVIVDTESTDIEEIKNGDLHHAHGMCQPLKALGGLEFILRGNLPEFDPRLTCAGHANGGCAH
jgi:hypothetical protein